MTGSFFPFRQLNYTGTEFQMGHKSRQFPHFGGTNPANVIILYETAHEMKNQNANTTFSRIASHERCMIQWEGRAKKAIAF